MSLDLDAIEARAAAATPGPWDSPDASKYPDNAEELHISNWCLSMSTSEDAQFIAHSRTDIPALTARVRETEADLIHERNEVTRVIHQLKAERDALREKLDALTRASRAYVYGGDGHGPPDPTGLIHVLEWLDGEIAAVRGVAGEAAVTPRKCGE